MFSSLSKNLAHGSRMNPSSRSTLPLSSWGFHTLTFVSSLLSPSSCGACKSRFSPCRVVGNVSLTCTSENLSKNLSNTGIFHRCEPFFTAILRTFFQLGFCEARRAPRSLLLAFICLFSSYASWYSTPVLAVTRHPCGRRCRGFRDRPTTSLQSDDVTLKMFQHGDLVESSSRRRPCLPFTAVLHALILYTVIFHTGALTLATRIDFLVNRPAPVIPFLRFFVASFFVFVVFFMHDVSRLAFLSLVSPFMPCTLIGLSTR